MENTATEIKPSKTPLYGHTSIETAYVVDDYPYGYQLRCKMRVWIEYKPRQGYRLMRQTTNPKVAFESWNKPKASTYANVVACMYLDENGHVHWDQLTYHSSASEALMFAQTYPNLEPEAKKTLDVWCTVKARYERNCLKLGRTPYGELTDTRRAEAERDAATFEQAAQLAKTE